MKKLLVLLALIISNLSYAQFTIGVSGGYNSKKIYFGPSIGGEIGYALKGTETRGFKVFKKVAILAQGEYFSPVNAKKVLTDYYSEYNYQISYYGFSFRKYFGKNRPNYSGFFLEAGGGSVIVNGSDSLFQIVNGNSSTYKTTYDNYTVPYGFLGTGWDFNLSPSFKIHSAIYKRLGNTQVGVSSDGGSYSYVEFPSTMSYKLGLNWVLGSGGNSDGERSRRVRSSKSANRHKGGRRAIKDYSDYKPW